MTIKNAIDGAYQGLRTDLYTYGMTGGLGTAIGAISGLFKPDAEDMDRAYAPNRLQGEPTRSFGGFDMFFDQLFGKRSSSTHSSDVPSWLKFGLIAVGASVLLPSLSRMAYFGPGGLIPPLPRSIYSTQFSPAQLIPLLWAKGAIPNWGMFAGLIH